MKNRKDKMIRLVGIFLVCIILLGISEPQAVSYGKTKITKYNKIKYGEIKYNINLRKKPSTESEIITGIEAKRIVKLTGYTRMKNKKWYFAKYKSHRGFIRSDLLKIIDKPKKKRIKTFREKMRERGFTDSYIDRLIPLHKKFPKWQFIAEKVDYTWEALVAKESERVGNNLVDTSAPEAYRLFNEKSYDFKKNRYKRFDGRWYATTEDVQRYYLDPRNFLNDKHIFQFMSHHYTADTFNTDTIRITVAESFLDTEEYQNIITKAGLESMVNPNVIAAMIIMEQGRRGKSPLISGKVKKYEGLYNFFNIGAYHSKGMTAVTRGLWWAKGEDKDITTFLRPWNTKQKSISGGAMYYGEKYIKNNQINYYTKKFNVLNGLSKVATHEYMTNVQGAVGEGNIIAKSLQKFNNLPLIFHIPIYEAMPESPVSEPNKIGNNDNYLGALEVKGFKLEHNFDPKINDYRVNVPADTKEVNVVATPHNEDSKVAGADKVVLKGSGNEKTVNIKVTSSSGLERTYTLKIVRNK